MLRIAKRINDMNNSSIDIHPDKESYEKIKADYEAKLKAEREKIAEDVANKMDYMGTCLNEKNIILGIITGERETLNSLCSTCKSESCIANHTAFSKADYEARLKIEMVAMLTEILTDFDTLIEPNSTRLDCESIIEQKIEILKERTDEENWKIDVIFTLEVLKAICPKYLRDYQALDYAISCLKTDPKHNLMHEGEEVYTKADIVAMLKELQLEIEESPCKHSDRLGDYSDGVQKGIDIIQHKIDKLKEVEE